MNISTLDLALAAPPASLKAALSFSQPAELDHTDVLIWDPAALYPHLDALCERHDPPVLGAAASEWLLATSRHWRDQFKRLLAGGGTLVVLVPAPRALGVHTLQEILPYPWWDPLMPRAVGSRPHAGTGAPRHAGEPFRTLFTLAAHCFEPRAVLDPAPGTAILEDPRGQPLASYLSEPPGRLLLLPAPAPALSQHAADATLFLQALRRCIERLGQRGGTRLAPWLGQHRSRAEAQLLERRARCLRERHALDMELQGLDSDLAEQDFFKQLIAGEGRGVGLAAAEVFRRKGAPVHADWLESDLHIAELDTGNLLVAPCLAPEALQTPALRRLDEARARVADYFEKPTAILVVDCSANALPLAEQAARVSPAPLDALREAYMLKGPHLYGWHLQQPGDPPTRLLQRLAARDPGLPASLWNATLRHLPQVAA